MRSKSIFHFGDNGFLPQKIIKRRICVTKKYEYLSTNTYISSCGLINCIEAFDNCLSLIFCKSLRVYQYDDRNYSFTKKMKACGHKTWSTYDGYNLRISNHIYYAIIVKVTYYPIDTANLLYKYEIIYRKSSDL